MIAPVCDWCDVELDEPGGLLFSPPDAEGIVLKRHACVSCYRALVPKTPEGIQASLTCRIERALLIRHPVTLPPERARNYAELAAFVIQGGS